MDRRAQAMTDALEAIRQEVATTRAAALEAHAECEAATLGWVLSLLDRERNRRDHHPAQNGAATHEAQAPRPEA